ncbi:unnamed protein product [Sphenostylis stenocarpa]|uniref:Uncharacterized protein n=1 Tax=Sphenostylis stenocarpa TaxID=92480 RepID=A0AA86T913_9FABA|nr:unnamed protein product [Sphenostylis stenocarpa]
MLELTWKSNGRHGGVWERFIEAVFFTGLQEKFRRGCCGDGVNSPDEKVRDGFLFCFVIRSGVECGGSCVDSAVFEVGLVAVMIRNKCVARISFVFCKDKVGKLRKQITLALAESIAIES